MKRRIINLVINLFVMHFVNKLLIEMCLLRQYIYKSTAIYSFNFSKWPAGKGSLVPYLEEVFLIDFAHFQGFQ